jgi:hypothetical protein
MTVDQLVGDLAANGHQRMQYDFGCEIMTTVNKFRLLLIEIEEEMENGPEVAAYEQQ